MAKVNQFETTVTALLREVDSLSDSLGQMRSSIARIAELELSPEGRVHVEKNLRSFLDRLKANRSTAAFREAASAFRSFHAGLM
jgi:hypothetical protein